MLSKEEITRYSRNILLDEVKRKGQENLKKARVTVIGAGGLGSPVVFYLAASGVGRIRLIDFDRVELTNLQRQILHTTSDISVLKTESAKHKISQLNPHVDFEIISQKVSKQNVEHFLRESDIVIEGSDNFETKFLINDQCINFNIPLIVGGILKFEGQILCVLPKKGACYRCIFEQIPPKDSIPNCSEAGVIGSVAGVIGSIQATEAIKYLLKLELAFFSKLILFDLKTMNLRNLNIQQNEKCFCN